jgi:Opacity protein and related surface antigens
MKRIMGTLVLLCLMALPGIASASDSKPVGVYVGGHLGMGFLNQSDRSFRDSETGFSYSPGDDSDTVFGGGISVGYDFSHRVGLPIRLELDYTARSEGEAKNRANILEQSSGKTFGTTKKDKISLQTLMVNAWVDIPTGTAVTPYLGGGIGFGFVNYKSNLNFVDLTAGTESGSESGSTNETNFAWSLGAGVAYDITERWTVDLGYRYIDAGEASVSFSEGGDTWGKSKVKAQTHDVMLGVRYTF